MRYMRTAHVVTFVRRAPDGAEHVVFRSPVTDQMIEAIAAAPMATLAAAQRKQAGPRPTAFRITRSNGAIVAQFEAPED